MLMAAVADAAAPKENQAPGRSMAQQATKSKMLWRTTDHSKHEILQKDFKSGAELTQACISCHSEAEKQFHKTIHWTWLDPNVPPEERIGKAGHSINNFCINLNSNEPRCTSCHIGSGWKDYLASGAICGIKLPAGLQQAAQLPEPIFTPSTKEELGKHDVNISFAEMVDRVGLNQAEKARDLSMAIYRRGVELAKRRGIIIADTKFEFGLLDNQLILIDEVLTPDSSRFWPADQYQPGTSPVSFDKQFVRDYLETLDWNKTAPGPDLPPEIIHQTQARYLDAADKLLPR